MQFILYDYRQSMAGLPVGEGAYAHNVSTLEGWHLYPTGDPGSDTDYVKWRMGRKRV